MLSEFIAKYGIKKMDLVKNDIMSSKTIWNIDHGNFSSIPTVIRLAKYVYKRSDKSMSEREIYLEICELFYRINDTK